jgi:cation diffusion facilitator family transporter
VSAADLTRYAWLAIAAAVATIALKGAAWLVTGSVGFLSDAAESLVNLAAAVMALAILRWAAAPEDEEHPFGHGKAEYFAAGIEGALILVAALTIAWAAIGRLADPQPIEQVGIGVVFSVAAAAVNLVVALVLMRAGRDHRSITLEADGRHLLTDVWTSAGVVIGVILVVWTGWERLDPLIALAVAVNIVVSGVVLLRRSGGGLMDRAMSEEDRAALREVLDGFAARGVRFHALRTRQSGRRAFVSVHVLVPGGWSVQRGHDLVEALEADLERAVPHLSVMTHLEPLEDPASYDDEGLDRAR